MLIICWFFFFFGFFFGVGTKRIISIPFMRQCDFLCKYCCRVILRSSHQGSVNMFKALKVELLFVCINIILDEYNAIV